MATYYINGYNSVDPTNIPYNTPDKGAPNLYILLKDLDGIIADGDNIDIYDGDQLIDDTAHNVEINVKVTISNTTNIHDIPINVKSSGVGITDNVGCIFNNVQFNNNNGTTTLLLSGSGAIVTNCKFTGCVCEQHIQIYSGVQGIQADGCTIEKSYIEVDGPTTDFFGILVIDGLYTKILENTINILSSGSGSGTGIGVVSNTATLTNSSAIVNKNVIYKTSNNVDSMRGIFFNISNDLQTINTITENVVVLKGHDSYGILYVAINGTTDDKVFINNNVVSITNLYSNDGVTKGIHVPQMAKKLTYTEIINNIIYYREFISTGAGYGSGSGLVMTDTPTTKHIAIEADIINGVIDYNDIFGFSSDVRFVHNCISGPIQELGPKNIFVDPQLALWADDSNTLDVGDIRLYNCYTNSECIGSGKNYVNMGVGALGVYDGGDYLNIVDTVTDNMGKITSDNMGKITSEGYIRHYAPTFFNNVLSDDYNDYNNWYRRKNGPYESDVYLNQWNFERTIPSTFPFETSDHFYKQSLDYVMENKGLLAPFEGIRCPSNPGYGYVLDYPEYETGLWGYPRKTYPNGCVPEPCIIQDSWTSTNIIQDTVTNVEFWILDKINPNCIT